MKRGIKDLVGLKGKVVLLRVDFNVPTDENGKILDYTRILSAIPTIEYLSAQGAKIVLMSHLGRPEGYEVKKSLWQVALFLMKRLKCNVAFCNKLVGDEVRERIEVLKDGNVLMLENVRFFKGEVECDKKLSQEIASMGDIFVNDAFATAHRENATTFGIATILPNAVGFLMEKEVEELSSILEEPKRPFVCIIGGAKVDTKLNILNSLVDKADTILIGGAMAYTFMKAKGMSIGSSLCNLEMLVSAKEILDKAEEKGKRILLPVDHVCIRKKENTRKPFIADKMIGDMVGFDIGPRTVKMFSREIKKAGTVFWNGPVGKFEDERYQEGTFDIARACAKTKAHTIAGGGDTISAINKLGIAKKFNFISTGGGASLEFIENGSLPCVDVIQEKSL